MTAQRVALVTGASSGFGQATAALLAKGGFQVFGTSRVPERYSAGTYEMLPLNVGSETSVLRMLKAVLPTMRKLGGGQIITVSSILGIVAMPYLGLYTASKFALEGMIEALQDEVRPFQIRVSLVEPVFFRTRFAAQPPAAPLAVYEGARQSVLRYVSEGVAQGPGPELVARRIVQLATSSRPPLRSYVGPRASLLVALRQWLPSRAFERVRRRVFHIERVPAFDFDKKAEPGKVTR